MVVGSGKPRDAKRFAAQFELKNPVVTDPTLEAYRRAGMKRGLRATFNLKAVKNAVRSFGGGFRQSATKGDPWQQGGVVVVGALHRGGKVLMQHAASAAGEPTDFATVARAVEAAAR